MTTQRKSALTVKEKEQLRNKARGNGKATRFVEEWYNEQISTDQLVSKVTSLILGHGELFDLTQSFEEAKYVADHIRYNVTRETPMRSSNSLFWFFYDTGFTSPYEDYLTDDFLEELEGIMEDFRFMGQ
ncbi:MAG: hypothetical protein ACLFUH_01850 [Bacteroidales bacterium]